MRSSRPLPLALAALLLALGAEAAPPLAPGEVLVLGAAYAGGPTDCHARVCRVDLGTGASTPISDALAQPWVRDLAVESTGAVLVLAAATANAATATLSRLDVASETFSVLAPSVASHATSQLAVAPDGRIFVQQLAGVAEVDAATGAVALVAPGSFFGVAAEPSGLLVALRYAFSDPVDDWYELVRIDPDTGVATGAGAPHVPGWPTQVFAFADDDHLVWNRSGSFDDEIHRRWRPAGVSFWLLAQSPDAVLDRAIALDGSVLVGSTAVNEPVAEIRRYSGTTANQLLASVDLDYAVDEIDAVRLPSCRNGVDDDADGAADHPSDPGCQSVAGRETTRCDDGLDNDGDGGIDWDGGGGGAAPDAYCAGLPWRNAESNPGGCGLGAELALVLGWLGQRARSSA
jgi:hypothetical protein